MKNKFLLIGLLSLVGIHVYADKFDYEESKKWAAEAIEDLPRSIDRLQSLYSQERLFRDVIDCEKDGYHIFIADWTSGHYRAVNGCIAKSRLKAALLSYQATPEKKAAFVQQAQEDATECISLFDTFRQSYLAYNVGNTQVGLDFLDKLANRSFKP